MKCCALASVCFARIHCGHSGMSWESVEHQPGNATPGRHCVYGLPPHATDQPLIAAEAAAEVTTTRRRQHEG